MKKCISPTNPLRLFYHKLWAIAAAIRFGFPAKKMIVIGVTGTDGKTTTCTLIHSILSSAGIKAGMLATTEFRIGEEITRNTTHKTTLGRMELQKTLRKMKDADCTHVVIETSSHAISQNRIWGIPYDIAVLTNLSPEHLDYHKTMNEYRREKAKLLRSLNSAKRKGVRKTAIINRDDPEFTFFNKIKCEQKMSYGKSIEADVQSVNEHCKANTTKFTLITLNKKLQITLNIPGSFNIYNALAAASVGLTLGIKDEAIVKGIENVHLVPGRMERLNVGQDFEVIIDFAMTAKGYETLLTSLKPITENKLWLVFGCCGDRDKDKRPVIGEIAAKYADRVVITDDEPYTEDPETIISMIEAGIKKTSHKKNEDYFIINDRKAAIEFAIKHANKGDTIVIPGMGDLEGRTLKKGIIAWSDRDVTLEILKAYIKDH